MTSIIGCTIGSLAGGMFLKMGRRKAGIFFQLPAIAGACLCMIENPYCFAIGRFAVGLTGGIANGVMGKSLDETVPIEVASQFGVLTNFYIVFGLIVAYFLSSAFLPMDEDKLADDQTWRILLFAPAVIGLINILAFICYFR